MSMDDWTNLEDVAGVFEKDGRYRVRTYANNPEGDLKQKQETLSPEAGLEDAIQRREEMKAEIRSPDPETEQKGGPPTNTIAGLAKRLRDKKVESGSWSESTAFHNRKVIAKKVLPVIGGVKLENFGRHTVQRWIEWAEDQRKDDGDHYSQSTLRRWWKMVRAIAKRAYLEGYSDDRFLAWLRECDGPQSPVDNVREQRTLSVDQLHKFLEVAKKVVSGRYAELVTLAYTGMRCGELYGLEWRDIDYEERIIHVRRAHWNGHVKETKTGMTRELPMIAPVERALRDHKEKLQQEGHVGLRKGIVFPSDAGTRRYWSSLTKPCRKVCEHAGIDIDVSPQVFRRTLNTLLANPDVDRLVLKSITGHEDDEMVEHYAGIRTEQKREAIVSIADKRGGEKQAV